MAFLQKIYVSSFVIKMPETIMSARPANNSQVGRVPKMPRSMRAIGADGGKKEKKCMRKTLLSPIKTLTNRIGKITRITMTAE